MTWIKNEKMVYKLEDQVIGLQNWTYREMLLIINPLQQTVIYIYTYLLKIRIIELENQLSEMQLISKSQDKTICCCSHNNHKTKINKDIDTQLKKEDSSHKWWLYIGYSMLNDINNRELSKTKKLMYWIFPGQPAQTF